MLKRGKEADDENVQSLFCSSNSASDVAQSEDGLLQAKPGSGLRGLGYAERLLDEIYAKSSGNIVKSGIVVDVLRGLDFPRELGYATRRAPHQRIRVCLPAVLGLYLKIRG